MARMAQCYSILHIDVECRLQSLFISFLFSSSSANVFHLASAWFISNIKPFSFKVNNFFLFCCRRLSNFMLSVIHIRGFYLYEIGLIRHVSFDSFFFCCHWLTCNSTCNGATNTAKAKTKTRREFQLNISMKSQMNELNVTKWNR